MMTSDPRLSSLIVRYEMLCEQGQTPNLADLCADTPELRPAVEEAVRLLMPKPHATKPPGTDVLVAPDGYDLLEEVGEGGMGQVFRAHHAALDRLVAIKFLHPKKYTSGTPLAEAAGRKFLDEARIAAKLQHPGIPAVHDVGTLPDGRPFLAMKLIQGKTLAALLKEQGHGSAKWLGVFEAVCQAMGAAHAAGYIHRDLKPLNIMVGAFGEVQVMDWGLAKQLGRPRSGGVTADELSLPPTGDDTVDVVRAGAGDDTDATRAGDVKGTLLYMPPEQARGEVDKIDRRADVFALGAILCELLTAQTPLTGTKSQILNDLVTEQFAAALARLDGCSEDAALIALAKRCIAAKPESRPADASEVAAAVAQFRAESEARAKRAETERAEALVRATETRKRQRALTWAGGMIAGVLVAGIVGTSIGAVEAWKQTGIARGQEAEATRQEGIARTNEAEAKRQEGIAKGETVEKEKALQAETAAKREEQAANTDLWAGLDVMTANIVGDSLGTQKAVSDEQKKFLNTVLPLYQKLAAKSGNDQATRTRVALAAFRVGMIENRVGRKEAGVAALRQARDDYAKLAADFPAAPEYRPNLASTLTNLGVLLKGLGQNAEAEGQHRKALDLLETLAADFPGVPEHRQGLANNHTNLGVLLRGLGQAKEAEGQHRKALTLREKLASDFPAVPEYRSDLAKTHSSLGVLLSGLGQAKEAVGQLRKALDLLETLAAGSPAAPEYRSDLAKTHSSLGGMLAGLGQGAEAEGQLRKALALQEKLASDFPAVPEYRSDLATTHSNLGVLLKRLGQAKEVEGQLRKALALQEKLAADFPAVPEYRSDLAKTHINLGVLLSGLGQGAEAEGQLRKALALLETLAADFPAAPEYRSDLAATHSSLGGMLAGLGQGAEAEGQLRKALALQEKLAADFPAVPEYRSDLATTHINLGMLLKDLGQSSEAEGQLGKALALLETLVADLPAVPEYRVNLGGSYCNFGHLIREGGKPADSLTWYDKAIATLSSILEAEPRAATARLFLRHSHSGRAKAYDRLQKYSEAVKDWDRVVEFTIKKEQPACRAARATSMLNAGQVADAVAEVAELEKLTGWDADRLYDFACVYSVASGQIVGEKQNYGEQALRLLGRAVKGGYKDIAHLKEDTDLDPLRERDDFKKLIADLEAKFPPKK